MMKKKIDYAAKFARLARKHKIHFGVCGSGEIDFITLTESFGEIAVHSSLIFGTKKAYDWLKQTIAEEKKAGNI